MDSKQFEELANFIQNRMRMSHIYQPVMLMTLLKNNGSATVDDIAKALLSRDISQTDYYSHITKNMVGRVLRNHQLVLREKNSYSLVGFEKLSDIEVKMLITLCTDKEEEYVARRGDRIWSHRAKSAGYISGTLRYEVLKRAHFRCELCGTSAEDKALEVDHIIPRNMQGSDDMSNLQSLCYSCNAMKRDRDDTDFRGISESYNTRDRDCVFCTTEESLFLSENELCFTIADINPITPNHTLVLPKRHVSDFFDLYQPEINAIHHLLQERRKFITECNSKVTGFNINVNSGKDAGQEIPHCHVHLVPHTAPS